MQPKLVAGMLLIEPRYGQATQNAGFI